MKANLNPRQMRAPYRIRPSASGSHHIILELSRSRSTISRDYPLREDLRRLEVAWQAIDNSSLAGAQMVEYLSSRPAMKDGLVLIFGALDN